MNDARLKLALRNSALVSSSLKARKLAEDRRVLCAAREYLSRHGAPTDPADLAEHQLIAFRDQSAKRLVNDNGHFGQFDPRSANCRLLVDDGASLRIATVAGAGVSINALWSIHRELKTGSLVQVLPDYTVDEAAALWLVYPKANVITAKVRVFIDFLIDRIGKSPAWLMD